MHHHQQSLKNVGEIGWVVFDRARCKKANEK